MVRIDPTYFRPTEVDLLIGDASKARARLGWKPKTPFAQLVKEMVASDLAGARQEAANRTKAHASALGARAQISIQS
jgi:GDPmannose 4,6-dehydratase